MGANARNRILDRGDDVSKRRPPHAQVGWTVDPVATQPLPPELTGDPASDDVHPARALPPAVQSVPDDAALVDGPPGAGAPVDVLEPVDPDDVVQLARLKPCSHCGGHHVRACPRVKKMSWHPNAGIASVEFWSDGEWSDEHVLWPDQIKNY